jgi:hypothetical protein
MKPFRTPFSPLTMVERALVSGKEDISGVHGRLVHMVFILNNHHSF